MAHYNIIENHNRTFTVVYGRSAIVSTHRSVEAAQRVINRLNRRKKERGKTYSFKVGDRVLYRGTWTAGTPMRCTITGVGEKNGRTVYDNDLDHWGYPNQYDLDLTLDSDGRICRRPAG